MTVVRRRFWRKEDAPEYVEGRDYTAHQLDLMADAILKDDSRREICRVCNGQGEQTGLEKLVPLVARNSEGEVIEDLKVKAILHQLACPLDH